MRLSSLASSIFRSTIFKELRRKFNFFVCLPLSKSRCPLFCAVISFENNAFIDNGPPLFSLFWPLFSLFWARGELETVVSCCLLFAGVAPGFSRFDSGKVEFCLFRRSRSKEQKRSRQPLQAVDGFKFRL